MPTKKPTETPAETPAAETAIIKPISTETILVPIIGTSPLLVHNWSSKAKRQMLEAMQGVKNPKEHKDPQAEYEAAFYRIAHEDGPDTYGFPAIGFKNATVGGARFYDKSVTMTDLRQSLFFKGVFTKADSQQLTPIVGEPRMREDVVKVGVNGRDLRYRPEFTEWSATLTITYAKGKIDRNSVLSLIDAGGMGVGVGEWRPEKRGDFGTYQVDSSAEVVVLP